MLSLFNTEVCGKWSRHPASDSRRDFGQLHWTAALADAAPGARCQCEAGIAWPFPRL